MNWEACLINMKLGVLHLVLCNIFKILLQEEKKINVHNVDHTYCIGSLKDEGNVMEVNSDVERLSEENVVCTNNKKYAVNVSIF